MTEREIYDGVIVEGTTDLFFVADVLQRLGVAWCLIGGLAVNTYASPVFGRDLPVASVEDLVRGKVWAWSDPAGRPTKRMKDALDLMRLVEVEPATVIRRLPAASRAQAAQIQAQPVTEDEDSMGEDE